MKKIISTILVITLMAAFSLTAFAADAKTDEKLKAGETSASTVDVKIDAVSLAKVEDVYAVDVAWDALDFTYSFTEEQENQWNPENHTYGEESVVGDQWDKTTANIVVTNHSNEAVSIAATIDTATKYGVTTTLSNANFDLATGEGLTYDTAANDTIGVSIAGVPNVTENFTIGTITVTVSAK